MSKRTKSNQLIKLTVCAIFISIILLMSFVPALGGYIKIGVIEISLIPIPVGIGTALLGPAYGAILGLTFGLTSFYQCFTTNVLGMLCLSISPLLTFIMCVPTRVLAALTASGVQKLFGLFKNQKIKTFGYAVSPLATAMSNTVLFVGVLVLAFGNHPDVLAGFGVENAFGIIATLVTINALIEAIVAGIIGGAFAYPLSKLEKALKYR